MKKNSPGRGNKKNSFPCLGGLYPLAYGTKKLFYGFFVFFMGFVGFMNFFFG
jgi:hypothetical protein